MKSLIATVLSAVTLSAWTLAGTGVQSSAGQSGPGYLIPRPTPPVSMAVLVRTKAMDTEIKRLTNELSKLEKDLNDLGYPLRMMDKRLSDAERRELMEKVLTASRLHNSISMLSLKRNEIQAGM